MYHVIPLQPVLPTDADCVLLHRTALVYHCKGARRLIQKRVAFTSEWLFSDPPAYSHLVHTVEIAGNRDWQTNHGSNKSQCANTINFVDKLNLSRNCDITPRQDCATRTLLNGYVISASMIFRETLQWYERFNRLTYRRRYIYPSHNTALHKLPFDTIK